MIDTVEDKSELAVTAYISYKFRQINYRIKRL